MKKVSKKLGAVVLALCMCFSLCATALAASSDNTTFSITIENSSNGTSYAVYKIFDVTYDDNGNYSYTVNSGSNWYTLFNSYSSFTVDEVTYEMPFVFTATTGEISGTYNVTVKTDAEGKALYTDDQIIGYLKAAINTIAKYDEATKTWTVEDGYGYVTSATGDGGALTIDLAGAGYYFVTSGVGAIVSVTTTDPNPTITDKNSTIDIEKNIVHSDGTEDSWEADGMGEDVSFDVKATVPIVEGEDYVVDYTITDSLTNGLLIELNEEDFYQGTDGKYYLSESLVNQWITLYDSTGNTLSSFTDNVYSYSFELVGYDAVTDETNTDETVHTFTGFILTYYTYDVDQYKTDLAAALVADGYGLDSIWSSYPEGWPDADQIGEDFDFPSESYFENSKYPTNASLEIKYSAHVSSLESYENTNTITLDHDVTPFNHPVPWQPTPGPQKWSRDYVYSWELQILKIDGDGSETPLKGATFTLFSENMQEVKVEYSWLYVQLSLLTGDTYTYTYEDGEGQVQSITYKVSDFESTYYVSDGEGDYKHVSVDDVIDEEGNYKNGYTADNVYRRIATSSEKVDTTVTTTHTATGTTDANGHLYFEGLGVGDYTLTEIVAPDGYNLLTEPIEFSIKWTEKDGFTVTYKDTESGYPSTMDDGYILALSIENNSGTELPGTGGIGTTIFYIIGGVLVVGAVVVLVTRRRMTREG